MSGKKRRPSPAGTGARQKLSGQAHRNSTSDRAPVHSLLDRLEAVGRRGEGRWLARCPAHGDHSPSLSIRETGDGTVLIKCFAGCSAGDIVAAVGLELGELFPNRRDGRGPLRRGERWIPKDVLGAVVHEALVALVAAETLHRGEALTADELNRLATAVCRLRSAAREVGCHV